METNLRLWIFIGSFFFFCLLENFLDYEPRKFTRIKRWPSNISIVFISTFLSRLLLPLGLIYFCHIAKENTIGFFNLFDFSFTIEFIASLFIFDFLIYCQHVFTHKIPWLWKIHRVHHTDIDLDVTTALRFHPLEILLSLVFKIIIIFVFGMDEISVFVFEIILSTSAMFNHSNINIKDSWDKVLRLFIVTPKMHLVHHSSLREESDMNYGFALSIWDRIFNSYLTQKKGITGQNYFRDEKEHRLWSLLKLPFIKK